MLYWVGGVTSCGSAVTTNRPFDSPKSALVDAFRLCFGNGVTITGSPPGNCVAPYGVRTDTIENPRMRNDGRWVADGRTNIVQTTGGCYPTWNSTSTWNELYIADPHRVPLLDRWRLKPRNQCSAVGNPIHPLLGIKTQEVELAADFGPTVRLTYNSSSRTAFALEASTFEVQTTQLSDLTPASSFGELWSGSQHRNLELRKAGAVEVVHALRPGGEWVGFDRRDSNGFVPDADISDRLLRRTEGSGWRYFAASAAQVEDYDINGVLMQAQRADGGGRLSYSYGASIQRPNRMPLPPLLLLVQDQFSRRVTFAYEQPASANAMPRIVSLTNASGRVTTFGYDTSSNLVRITWPDATVRRFLYENAALPWALTGVIDESGKRLSTIGYDAEGRAMSTELTGGVNRYHVAHVRPPSWQISDRFDESTLIGWREHTWKPALGTVLTRPNGSTSSLNSNLLLGQPRLNNQSQPAGSGCAASASNQSYDVNGNLASRDDFNGNRVCYANDLSRNLETTRVEGLAGGSACTATAAGAALPAGARKTSTLWHPDWSLRTRQAEPGRVTTWVYNGQPDPYASGALASCAPANAVLPDGKPIAVLCRQVEQATDDTDDTDGAQGFAASVQSNVPAREQKWTYNAFGQVLTHDGPRTDVADITVNEYYTDTSFTGADPNAVGHTLGDLKQTTSPAGHVTRYSQYNKMGQVLQMLDPNGVATSYTYDARQRLTSTTTAGQTTVYEYWPAGLLKRTTQADLSWVHQDYDDAHRLTRVSDNLGNSISYTLDNMGNRIAEEVRDPSNSLRRVLSRSIDALGRVQQVTGRE